MTLLAPNPTTDADAPRPAHREPGWRRWLDTELSSRSCVAGWIAATVLFVVLTTLSGGPGKIDAQESVYSTWAIAHGEFQCAFPTNTVPGAPLIAPVYPVVSGAVAAVTGIGHGVAFPSHAALGPNCDHADAAINNWALQSGAFGPTRVIGYTGWLVLLAGLVAWLRSIGRGRRRWEHATLLAVAAFPLVWSSVGFYFHPQDLYALGFGLGAMACAKRQRWAAAGALIALAVLSQQFALLMAAPLLVLAPAGRRARYLGGAAVATACFVGPLLVASAGSVFRAITLGSGNNPSTHGGTVMWQVSSHGASMVLASRVLPIALALAVSWWVVRRLGGPGPVVASPANMVALVALCLSLRLMLEQNLFEYYFVALAVTLILLDITRGRIRGSLVAWLVTLTMTFSVNGYFLGVKSGLSLEHIVAPVVLLATLALAAVTTWQGSWSRWKAFLTASVLLCTLLTWTDGTGQLFHRFSTALLQVIFVGTGALLAATPLLEAVQARRRAESFETGPELVNLP